MIVHVGQTVELIDSRQRRIGSLAIEGMEAGQLWGTFTRGPDYDQVAGLIRDFVEAAEGHALAVADRRMAEIDALELELQVPETSERLAVRDVQIWDDGAMSCRPRSAPVTSANGAAAANASAAQAGTAQ